MNSSLYPQRKQIMVNALERAGISITKEEQDRIMVLDFNLDDIARTGLQVLVYVNTERVCAKELVLTPGQTCGEHLHRKDASGLGKEETFRCRAGKVYLYVEGEPTASPQCRPPAGTEQFYTVRHEIILSAGEQYTLAPGNRHWFQAGASGAIVSEFSTGNDDSTDVFTNPNTKDYGVCRGE